MQFIPLKCVRIIFSIFTFPYFYLIFLLILLYKATKLLFFKFIYQFFIFLKIKKNFSQFNSKFPMENFCLENLRGKEAWLKEKLPLNVYSDETSKLFDSALRQLISWFECEQIGGLLGTIEKMNKSEPDFCNF
uniref:Uncharacterized protein n=1 Tax=Meloidogyne enterolobii TaxID=390850 RepID=A0A6V7UE65_MELEN|nr:unnamed protein product [Meloidogyne enterolobii]